MSEPILTLQNVSKAFDDIEALSHITLDVHPGELLVVLGPTGAGKTTLLRCIAGLEQTDEGHMAFNKTDITNATPADRNVALVFQNFSLYANKTVGENLAFPLRAPKRNITETDIMKRVQEVAKILHITPLLDKPATHLSGGEMQRVAIGRAIVRRPHLFLMDEPLTNLDAKLRETLRVEIIRLQRQLATPMIYVTHDQTEALSMADRIAVLSEGRILQIGSPQDIYNHPASPEIAKQLGYPPINLFDVRAHQGHWQTASGTDLLPCPTDAPSTATLGVRPENIALEDGQDPATIEVVEDMGPATILLAKWAEQHIHILVSGETQLKPGDQICPRITTNQTIVWPKP